jgi:hypothetical protein
MQAVVLDILCMIKVTAYLDTLKNMDLLKEAELRELDDYVQQLHKRAYPPQSSEEQ